MCITSPRKFPAWLTEKYIEAYRQITAADVEDMITSRLTGRYGSYSESLDGETIRGILQYEQLQEKRPAKEVIDGQLEPPK